MARSIRKKDFARSVRPYSTMPKPDWSIASLARRSRLARNVLFTAISLTEKYKFRLLCAMQTPVCCGITPLLQ